MQLVNPFSALNITPWLTAAAYLREGSIAAADVAEWESILLKAGALDGDIAGILREMREVLPQPSRLRRLSSRLAPRETWRGHHITEAAGGWWIYTDTGQAVADAPSRPCGACGLPNTPEGFDGCLGKLPGVVNACCGHGAPRDAYAVLANGARVAGVEAAELFRSNRRN